MYSLEQLNEKVHNLRALKRQAEELEEMIKSIESEIKSEMDERKEYELVGDDWKITWNLVSSNRFNQSLFKSQHPDIYEKFMNISESRRFLLS